MAIDEISESVHRQERPQLRFPPKAANEGNKNVIILGTSGFELGTPALEASTLLSHCVPGRRSISRPTTPTPQPLWPPLKSSRYCKKLQKRAGPRKGLNAATMFLYEGAINHSRLSQALDEIAFADASTLVVSELDVQDSSCFWSRKACRDFWDEYLRCDEEAGREESETETATVRASPASTDAQTCFRRISPSFRRLLKRSVRGTQSFAELEQLVVAFSSQVKVSENFSCGQVVQQEDSFAVVRLITPFHRVWLHAICQFYGLSSVSKTVENDRLVTVKLRRRAELPWPEEKLVDYLERF